MWPKHIGRVPEDVLVASYTVEVTIGMHMGSTHP